jgi:hypothetical protein
MSDHILAIFTSAGRAVMDRGEALDLGLVPNGEQLKINLRLDDKGKTVYYPGKPISYDVFV